MSHWLLLFLVFLLLMFPIGQPNPQKEVEPTATFQQKDDFSNYVKDELLAMTDTKEQAEAIAQQYDIELVRWNEGLALFHTERNVLDVISEGKENGWPALSLNNIRTLPTKGPR